MRGAHDPECDGGAGGVGYIVKVEPKAGTVRVYWPVDDDVAVRSLRCRRSCVVRCFQVRSPQVLLIVVGGGV